MERNVIYQGSCLDVLKNFEDGSVDLVVTDPPYKLNESTGGRNVVKGNSKWNGNIKSGDVTAGIENNIEFSEWLPEAYRVLKNGCHAYFFVNDKNLRNMLCSVQEVGFKLHNVLVWKKNNATPNRWYMKDCEFIVFVYKGPAKKINDMGSKQLMEVKNINGRDKLHPTEKPVPILETLVANSSKEGELVLDLFAGSGSTGKAARNLNRDYILVEIDDKHVKTCESELNLNRVSMLKAV